MGKSWVPLGVILSTMGILSTVGVSWCTWVIPWALWGCSVLLGIPSFVIWVPWRISWCMWGYHEYHGGVQYHGGTQITKNPPMVLNTPRYSRYPPHALWYAPWYWTPPRYWAPPPPPPTVPNTHYTGWSVSSNEHQNVPPVNHHKKWLINQILWYFSHEAKLFCPIIPKNLKQFSKNWVRGQLNAKKRVPVDK